MEHRCGRHAVVANPSSRIPIRMECVVHRGPASRVADRFAEIVGLEFYGEEILRYGWIVEHGMLDDPEPLD